MWCHCWLAVISNVDMWLCCRVTLLSNMPSAKRPVNSARGTNRSTTGTTGLWLRACPEVVPIVAARMWCNGWLAVASLIMITHWPKSNVVSSSSELFRILVALRESVANHHYIWNVRQLFAGSRIIYVQGAYQLFGMLIHIVALEFAPDYLEDLKGRLFFHGAQKLFDSF